MLPAEYLHHRPVPSTSFPCRAWLCRLWRPFFGGREATVDEALVPANLLAIVELVEKGAPERHEHAALLPLPQAAPAGRRAPVSPRQFAPRRARPEDPEDALETATRVGPGPPSARVALSRGSCGRIRSHCASVRARHAMRPRYRALPFNPSFEMTSNTLTSLGERLQK